MQGHLDERIRFGTHIKGLREKMGKSLNIFCFENDISKSELSKLERGLIDFKFSTLCKIAEAFQISLNEIFKYTK